LTNTVNDFFDLKMNTQSAGADWSGGGQITVGYAWRGVGGPAVAVTYWGLTPMKGSASVSDTTGNPATALNSTIDFSQVTVNGQPGNVYFSGAQEQALWRTDRADNFEVNFQTESFQVGSFKIAGLGGFRYFRFSDDLLYGSASFGNSFTSNGGADAAYLRILTINNLFGAQLGSIITSQVTDRLTFFATPKVGAFGNQMISLQQLYAGSGPSNFASNFKDHKADFAGLAELDLGLAWAIRPNILLTGGYRLVAVANLALADNQYTAYTGIAQNGDLILHGILAGFTWTF